MITRRIPVISSGESVATPAAMAARWRSRPTRTALCWSLYDREGVMSSQEDIKIPIRLLLVPPMIAALVIGFGVGVIAYGVALKNNNPDGLELAVIWTGTGVIIGFLWGSIIWAGKLVGVYRPKTYYKDTEPAVYEQEPDVLTARVQVELREDNGADWIDLPDDITLQQLIEVAKILERNDFNFSHALCRGDKKPLERPQFETLRDRLIEKRFARWKNPNSHTLGIILLHPGRRLFKQLATYQDGQLPSLLELLR